MPTAPLRRGARLIGGTTYAACVVLALLILWLLLAPMAWWLGAFWVLAVTFTVASALTAVVVGSRLERSAVVEPRFPSANVLYIAAWTSLWGGIGVFALFGAVALTIAPAAFWLSASAPALFVLAVPNVVLATAMWVVYLRGKGRDVRRFGRRDLPWLARFTGAYVAAIVIASSGYFLVARWVALESRDAIATTTEAIITHGWWVVLLALMPALAGALVASTSGRSHVDRHFW